MTTFEPVNVAQSVVAAHFHLTVADMTSANRERRISHPRQMAMAICREISSLSLSQIGKRFGGRDHSTVLHALDAVERRKVASSYRMTFDDLRLQAEAIIRPVFIRQSEKPVFRSVRGKA